MEDQIEAMVSEMRRKPWYPDLQDAMSDPRLRAIAADYVRGLTAPFPDVRRGARQARATADSKPAGRRRRRTAADVPRDFFPFGGEEVERWPSEDWLLVERALRRLRVRPADQARKAKLVRGIHGKLDDLGEAVF